MIKSFLNKLYDTQNGIPLSILLLEAKSIAKQYDNKELIEFIDKEINGYKVDDEMPEYRQIKSSIVADINDVFGNIVKKEYKIDFTILSEKLGFDMNICYMPDGISFIETAINNLSGKEAIKPMPIELVKKLDEVFHYNNKHLHLKATYHKIYRADIEYILTKTRHKLIEYFYDLNNGNSIDVYSNNEFKQNANSKIKIFVSYAWEDQEHNDRVISFVDFLRKKGFDASMDRRESQIETAVNFNSLMINGISSSDKVIVVLSKKYKEKGDSFQGGVWQELNMILQDIKKNSNKYIFVYWGYDNRDDITPLALSGRDILNLKDDQDNEFNNLFAKIKQLNLIEFSEVGNDSNIVNKMKIKPFEL